MFSSFPNLLSAVPLVWAGSGQERAGTGSLALLFCSTWAHRIPASSSIHMHAALQADPASCPAQPRGSVQEREGKGGKASRILCVGFISCEAWIECRITKSSLLWGSKSHYTPVEGCQPTALPAGISFSSWTSQHWTPVHPHLSFTNNL